MIDSDMSYFHCGVCKEDVCMDDEDCPACGQISGNDRVQYICGDLKGIDCPACDQDIK